MIHHPLDGVERRPYTCIWEITRACNLRCIHCENFGGKQSASELSSDELLKVADDLAALGGKHVDITGGEPLLYPKWDAFAAALNERGMRTALITNGTLLDDEQLDRAVAAGVEIVAFSIDGPRAIHDKIRSPGARLFRSSPFEKTVDALGRTSKRLKTKIITQVNVMNIGYLPEIRTLLNELGVKAWQLQLAVPVGRVLEMRDPFVIAPSALEELTAFIVAAQRDGQFPRIDTSDNIGYYTEREKMLRKRESGQGVWLGCQAGIRSVSITYDGKVRGCSILPPEFDAGDLHLESLVDIWRDKERFGFSTAFDPSKLEGDCARCQFGPLCRAGCTSMAYYTGGTIYNNPFCISRPGILQDAPQPVCASKGGRG